MSLYNVLRTGTSGMDAQATKLSTVAENIANANTVGYKRADAEFSTLVLDAGPNAYSSGAVSANIRYDVSSQGALTYTLSKTDIAVEGDGFFIVEDRNGGDFLTRAGSFVLDGQSGNLVNAAGFSLLGLPSTEGEDSAITLNDTGGLEPINLDVMNMRATPSTVGEYRVNLDARQDAIVGNTAGDNAADSSFTVKSSIIAYDDLGAEVTLDVYWSKVVDYAPGTPPTDAQWEMVVYDQSQADPSITTEFPYTTPQPPIGAGTTPDQPFLARATVTFDQSTGAITQVDNDAVSVDGTPVIAAGATTVDPDTPPLVQVALPNATQSLTLDLTGTIQLGADFEPLRVSVNGNAPSTVQDVAIDNNGTVFAVYENGQQIEFYRLPLANVPSPDQLDVLPGNVYSTNSASGDLRIALPDDAGNGSLVVGALEQSNVDLGSELTDMIVSQRGFTANSRSFQTGDDLLEVLINLGR